MEGLRLALSCLQSRDLQTADTLLTNMVRTPRYLHIYISIYRYIYISIILLITWSMDRKYLNKADRLLSF